MAALDETKARLLRGAVQDNIGVVQGVRVKRVTRQTRRLKFWLSGSLVAVALVVVGCTGATAPSATPARTDQPSPPSSRSPTPTPSVSPSASPPSGLYLRAWQSQALLPPSAFLSGPMLTVSDGILIDNNVAIMTPDSENS